MKRILLLFMAMLLLVSSAAFASEVPNKTIADIKTELIQDMKADGYFYYCQKI